MSVAWRLLKLSFLCCLTSLTVVAHGAQALSIDTQVRLIGGYLPQGSEANLPEVLQITQSPAWRQASAAGSMAAIMRKSPGYFSAASIAQMQSFFLKNATAASNESQSVLYFFGGADALYPSVVFPNMTKLLIVGLENPGQISDAAQLSANGTLTSQMQQVATAYRDLVQVSFFLTKHMSQDLQQFGTATMIAVGIVARGNTILSEQTVSLDKQGQIVTGGSGRVRGIQIQYAKPNGQQAEVIYFGMDLSDANLKTKPEFAAYISAAHFDTAFYKAASYVSYHHGFENLNRLVLGNVRHVIENDDGIPFSSLRENAAQWSLKLFGHYSTPSVLFGSHVDEDLLTAYDQALCPSAGADDLAIWKRQWPKACTRPATNFGFASLTWNGTLPFRYGYTWQTGASPVKAKFSNLLVLDRQ
jgi:hypothetical protein